MDLSNPATVALSPGMAGVLRVLSGAEAAFTIRSLARLAGVSHTYARDVVNRLDEHGLVYTEEQGPSRLCRFNWDHLAAGALAELVRLRSRLLDFIRNDIEAWSRVPEHASLFGSAARGDGGTQSDLDILVLRPPQVADADDGWDQQLAEASERIHAATGNAVAWFDVTRQDLLHAQRKAEPVIDEWRHDSVHLVGAHLNDILRSLA